MREGAAAAAVVYAGTPSCHRLSWDFMCCDTRNMRTGLIQNGRVPLSEFRTRWDFSVNPRGQRDRSEQAVERRAALGIPSIPLLHPTQVVETEGSLLKVVGIYLGRQFRIIGVTSNHITPPSAHAPSPPKQGAAEKAHPDDIIQARWKAERPLPPSTCTEVTRSEANSGERFRSLSQKYLDLD